MAETRKKISLIMTQEVFDRFEGLARKSGKSMAEVVRLGLGLVNLVLDAKSNGNKVVITTSTGKALKEVVLPD